MKRGKEMIDLKEITSELSVNLKRHLGQILPHHAISEIYEYALFPTGKLFRPLLVYAIGRDFKRSGWQGNIIGPQSDFSYLASAVEMHHAYTLIHDDLPAMDNDDYRRGKLTVHKKYNEWKALLVGDGLCVGPFALLSQIKSPAFPDVLKFFSWALGPKGLILGQVLDLSEEMNHSFVNLITTHRLKTARLIQTAIVGSYLLTLDEKKDDRKQKYRECRDLYKLGDAMGVSFQLLDDLTELAELKITEREQKINPWLRHSDEALQTLLHYMQIIKKITSTYNGMPTFSLVLDDYLSKIKKILNEGSVNIERHLPKKEALVPIMGLFD